MANFEKMIPFILHCETGLALKYMSLPLEQMFAQAKKTGYANDPSDSGGPTMCGVILSTYASYRKKQGYQQTTIADLKNISFKAWRAILKEMFWDRWQADKISNEMVAIALVDWVWGSGKYGITRPQKLLGVVADGIVGNKTLTAVNSYPNQQELFNKIQKARNDYHASIAKPGTKNAKFLRGWNRRVAMITFNGFNYNV